MRVSEKLAAFALLLAAAFGAGFATGTVVGPSGGDDGGQAHDVMATEMAR